MESRILRQRIIKTLKVLFFSVLQIGHFFGTIDPMLMRTLVNSSLYTVKKTFDYQLLCDPKKESRAAAGLRSVYVVSYISQTRTEPPTCAHNPALVCSHILISTHIFTNFFPLQERTDK